MSRTQNAESAAKSLIEFFESDERVSVNEGRDALLDLCEAYHGRTALTNPLGNESYHACRQQADSVERCHWIRSPPLSPSCTGRSKGDERRYFGCRNEHRTQSAVPTATQLRDGQYRQ